MATNVSTFSIVGDGSTDNATNLQTAVNTLTGTGGDTLYAPTGHYLVNSQIDWKDKVNFNGDGKGLTILDFSNESSFSSSRGFFQLLGTGLSNQNTINASVLAGGTSVVCSAAVTGIQVRDYVQIRTSESYNDFASNISFTTYAASTSMSRGNIVLVSGNIYVCITAGTTGASSAPSGTGTSITDGTVTWAYAVLRDTTQQTPWPVSTAVSVGNIRVTAAGNIYVCIGAGTTSTTAPSSTTPNSAITDNTATWAFVTYYNAHKAEFNQVQSISGSTIYLCSPLAFSYPQSGASSYTVTISTVTFAKAKFSNCTIIGKGMPTSLTPLGTRNTYTGASADIGIEGIWANIELENVEFRDIEQYAVMLQCCYKNSATNIEFSNDPRHLDSQQYGIFMARGTNGLRMQNIYGENCRHLVSTDGSSSVSHDYFYGVPTGLLVSNFEGRGIWQSAVDTHAAGREVLASNGLVYTVAAGLKSRSKGFSASNVTIIGTTDLADFQDGAFSGYYGAGDINLSNIRSTGCYHSVYLEDTGATNEKINISGSTFANAQQNGIEIGGPAQDIFNKVNLTGIIIDNPGHYQINTPSIMSQFNIGNFIGNGGANGLRCTDTSSINGLTMNGYNITNTTGEALYVDGVTNFAIDGGIVSSTTTSGNNVRIRNSSRGAVGGVQINAASSLTGSGIYLNAVTSGAVDRVSIRGANIYSPSGTGTAINVDNNVTNSFEDGLITNCSTPITTGSSLSNYLIDSLTNSVTLASDTCSIRNGTKIVYITPETGVTDNLATCNYNGVNGDVVMFRTVSDSDTITAKDGTGNFRLQADRVLDKANDTLTCMWSSSVWVELAFANNN